MKVLYVDDVRNCSEGWPVVRSFEEAKTWLLENGCPDFITFDHDLGEGPTGYDLVKWMVEFDMDMEGSFIPEDFLFDCHSANPVGKQNIMSYLKDYMKYRLT